MIACAKGLYPAPVGDVFVLDPAEQTTLNAMIDAYNSYIKSKATAIGFGYYDPNVLFAAQTASGAIPPFPIFASSTATFGTLISLDGVHPSAAAHMLIANDLITVINDEVRNDPGSTAVAARLEREEGADPGLCLPFCSLMQHLFAGAASLRIVVRSASPGREPISARSEATRRHAHLIPASEENIGACTDPLHTVAGGVPASERSIATGSRPIASNPRSITSSAQPTTSSAQPITLSAQPIAVGRVTDPNAPGSGHGDRRLCGLPGRDRRPREGDRDASGVVGLGVAPVIAARSRDMRDAGGSDIAPGGDVIER